MSNSFFKYFFLNILLIVSQPLFSQEDSDNNLFVSVNVNIIAEGTPKYSKDTGYYFALATIKNNQDTAISFWIMSCSWPTDNWKVDGKNIYFRFYGCDSNFPTEIRLMPQKTIKFYGAFKANNKNDLENKYFRLGFLYFPNVIELNEHLAGKSKENNIKKYWSNKLKLEDNLFKYEVE